MNNEPKDYLDRPLIEFAEPDGHVTNWTIRDAVEGLSIMGGIGSGKTSGSGKMIALKYLEKKFGGLVLTVKPDEKALWQHYCLLAGREKDLIIVEPGGEHFFNFLQYESTASEGDVPLTTNIVQVLKTVINASDELSNEKSNDPFWEKALDLLLYNTIDLCLLAYGKVTVQRIYDIVQSLPNQQKQVDHKKEQSIFEQTFLKAKENVKKLVDVWHKEHQELVNEVEAAGYSAQDFMYDDVYEARTLKMAQQFFFTTYLGLSDKTRSIIDFSFAGFLFRLLKDPVYTLFCNNPSTFTPEDSLNGKIILINLNVKKYNEVGRDAQIMFKYIWQRAMERRNIDENGRPVFLWADEAQNFIHQYDATYQATARSSRIATVYLTQNLPNYHASMGGSKAEYKVKSFLGTLGTKIFHANSDLETNKYSSDLIGQGYQKEESETTSNTDGKESVSYMITAKLSMLVRPEEFPLQKTGGDLNGKQVQGYVILQGKQFANGFNYKKITFKQ